MDEVAQKWVSIDRLEDQGLGYKEQVSKDIENEWPAKENPESNILKAM